MQQLVASAGETLDARRMRAWVRNICVEIVVHDVAVADDEATVDDRVPRRHRPATQPRLDRVGDARRRTPARSAATPRRRRRRPGSITPSSPTAAEARCTAERGASPAPCAPCRPARRRAAWPAASPGGPPATATRCRPTTTRRRRGRRARRRRASATTGAMPDDRIRLLLGQCATPTPAAPSRATSSSFGHHAVGDPRAIADTSRCARGTPSGGSRTSASENASSSAFSAKWVCSRTSSRSASSAERTISASVTLNGEHGASAIAHHRPVAAVVVAGDGLLAGGEDLVVVGHHVVGRQPAVLLAQRHRAARRVEAHAEVGRRGDLGRQQVAGAARVQVEVVGRRRAARQRQLGEADPRRRRTPPPRRSPATAGTATAASRTAACRSSAGRPG